MIKNTFEITNNVAWQLEPIENFIYIYNIKDNYYIYLEDTAKEIWHLICDKNTTEEIAKKISEKYQVEFIEVLEDTKETIQDLIDRGVINLENNH
ncbi:MAG: PqqD family protein [Defluviitaleaceae bacterium]|nr:PqqD family protein [Defluviitaleaceae bacterium]